MWLCVKRYPELTLDELYRLLRLRVASAEAIYLEAQVYARRFYERQGFRQVSDEYIDDGIPHIRMLLNIGEG